MTSRHPNYPNITATDLLVALEQLVKRAGGRVRLGPFDGFVLITADFAGRDEARGLFDVLGRRRDLFTYVGMKDSKQTFCLPDGSRPRGGLALVVSDLTTAEDNLAQVQANNQKEGIDGVYATLIVPDFVDDWLKGGGWEAVGGQLAFE